MHGDIIVASMSFKGGHYMCPYPSFQEHHYLFQLILALFSLYSYGPLLVVLCFLKWRDEAADASRLD